MEHLEQKVSFLKNEFAAFLRSIRPETQPLFGKMNPHQMAEHMATYIRMGYGNPRIEKAAYSEEIIGKMNAFLRTEKPLRPNTSNPLMEETPPTPLSDNFEDAIKDVEAAISELFISFEQNPELEIYNPFFGKLDFAMTVQLLYKHSQHHLRQFGVIE